MNYFVSLSPMLGNIILDGEKAKRQKLTIIYLKSIAMATYYIGFEFKQIGQKDERKSEGTE